MFTKGPSSTIVGNEANVQSAPNVQTLRSDPGASRKLTVSPPHSSPTVNFPQRPQQAHPHCYPPTRSMDSPSCCYIEGAIAEGVEPGSPGNSRYPPGRLCPALNNIVRANERAEDNLPLPVAAMANDLKGGVDGSSFVYALILLTFGIIVAVHVFV